MTRAMHDRFGAGHLARGRLLFAQRRHDLAAKELREAAATAPVDPEAPAWLALVLTASGKPKEALAAGKEAVRRGPDYAFAHTALGYALWATARAGEAVRSGCEALRLDPREMSAHILLARLAEAAEDWPAALRHADEALRVSPFEGRAAAIRGHALVRLGRSGEAIDALTAALRAAPESADLHGELGWACLHVGRQPEALDHLRKSLRLNPLSDEARHRLAEALKSRNWFYRGLLRSALSFGRRRNIKRAIPFLLACYVLLIVAAIVMESSLFLWLLAGAVVAFVLWMWQRLSGPLFDLFLEFDPFGRRLLTRDQRAAAWTVAACFAVGAAQAVLGIVNPVFFAFAVASTTFVPRLLIQTFAESSAVRRGVRLFLLSPSVALFDLGITAAALSGSGLIPDVAGTVGGFAAIAGVIGFFVGGFVLGLLSPPRLT